MNVVVIQGDARALLSVRTPLLSRLVELGHKVHALAPLADEDVVASIEELGVEHATYPLTRGRFSPLADLGTLLHLKQVLFRIKPDVVLCISHKPVTFGPMAARMTWVDHPKKIYALVTGLGYPFTEMSGWKRRVVHAYAKYFMGGGFSACHGIVFRNPEDREFFRAFGVLPGNAATTVIDEPLPAADLSVDGEAMAASTEALLSFMELI
ncbi:glycosyltransferase [Pseudodesulfovibrio portus]|uniref:Glycosyltransferase subfamily 4-like N-terminal domain-containing protein n=1 Tax=Pseudodesulfovibrio portus TaxID=231439 RepID=A0ABM8ASB5_9BACT|nr:glycosyltransferase [Pseudodesulfovibrio portus]BDQ34324.1 hypothetical protein JCM14722_18660 [Pseudodesulfovibrio portus]